MSRTNQVPNTNDSLTEQVNEILDMLEHESNDQQESEPDQEADIASDNVELSWDDDPEFAVEVTVENDVEYQPLLQTEDSRGQDGRKKFRRG